jgi:saccharopine dehydrogenase-like NADP-dependent oxidoreductase
VRTLLPDASVRHVVIADRDGERAAAFADACGPKTSARRVDVTDEAALRAAIEDADVVMSAVGPYFRFGVPILRACLEVGRGYVDVCDDWAPTLAMLEQGAQARNAGVTAIIGLGITPGVSNLLAALVARELDEVDALWTGWDLERAMPEEIGAEPSAATLHGVEQLSGRIRVRRGGRDVDERPVRKVRIDYPGLGRRRAYTIGHPEPVTLPLAYPGLRECLNVMTARRATVFGIRALATLVNVRLLSPRRAARWAERFGGRGGRTPDMTELVTAAKRTGRMRLPPLFALAAGRKNGEMASAAATLLSGPAGGIGGLTGVPLAIGARLLASRAVTKPGVWAPEAVLDPRTFLDALAPLCAPPRTGAADLVLVTRSWETRTLQEALQAAL